jgi:hypothetical protein
MCVGDSGFVGIRGRGPGRGPGGGRRGSLLAESNGGYTMIRTGGVIRIYYIQYCGI